MKPEWFFPGAFALALAATACSSPSDEVVQSVDAVSVRSSFTTKATGYYPDSSALEGGFNDRTGKPLRTLQAFLEGKADYVSVAMDSKAFPYGTRLRIHELEAKYQTPIVFRVVDTGGAFRNMGLSRMDICTANEKASLDPTLNGPVLHVDVIDEGADEGASDDSNKAETPPTPERKPERP